MSQPNKNLGEEKEEVEEEEMLFREENEEEPKPPLPPPPSPVDFEQEPPLQPQPQQFLERSDAEQPSPIVPEPGTCTIASSARARYEPKLPVGLTAEIFAEHLHRRSRRRSSLKRARDPEGEPPAAMMQRLWRPAERRGRAKGKVVLKKKRGVGELSARNFERFAKDAGCDIPRGSSAFDFIRQGLHGFLSNAITKACELSDERGGNREVSAEDMECAVQAALTANPVKRRDDQDDDGDDGNNGGGDNINGNLVPIST